MAEILKSASQEICLGESVGRNTQICQSGNLLGGISWQKYPNLPVSKSLSRFTKSAHQEICWGEGICWQKFPNLPVRKSAWGNLWAEIPKSASQEICWEESANRNIQIYQSVKLPADSPNMSAEIPISASQEICWGESASRNSQICQ